MSRSEQTPQAFSLIASEDGGCLARLTRTRPPTYRDK